MVKKGYAERKLVTMQKVDSLKKIRHKFKEEFIYMFNKQELSMIASALVHESINIKDMLANNKVECDEEFQSLENKTISLDELACKVSELLKG